MLMLKCPCVCVCARARLPHLERVAVQITDREAKLLHILCDALIGMCQAPQHTGSIVGAVAGVQLMQTLTQPGLEGQLQVALHEFEAAVDDGRRHTQQCKVQHTTCKRWKVLSMGAVSRAVRCGECMLMCRVCVCVSA